MAIPNPVAYYKLDSNSNDSIGSVNGTDTSISYVAGKIGNSASATNGYIDFGTGNFGVTNQITISFWFYLTSNATNQILFQKSNNVASATDSYYIIYIPASNTLQTFIGNGSENTFVNHTGFNPSLNTWHHLVFTYNGTTGNQIVYLNGSLFSSIGGGPSTINNAASAVRAMAYFSPAQFFMQGRIDEMGIWNTELTASQVSELFPSFSSNFLQFF